MRRGPLRDNRADVASPSRVHPALVLVAPILAAAALAGALTLASQETGRVVVETGILTAPSDAREDPDVSADPSFADAGSSRFAPDGAILAPPDDTRYACLQPDLPIPAEDGCDEGRPYPACRWQLPDPREVSASYYRIWRNTTPEHRWARPGLVSLILAAAREYAARWPEEQLIVGDLDAPGPRHQTHDRGVDVDLYLPDAMIARNDGGGRYPDNYEGRPAEEVALLRARVMDLARILASCSRGQLRIYYNDPEIVDAFVAWTEEQGMASSVGPPMTMHNRLHRFHFHMTVAEDIEPLPTR